MSSQAHILHQLKDLQFYGLIISISFNASKMNAKVNIFTSTEIQLSWIYCNTERWTYVLGLYFNNFSLQHHPLRLHQHHLVGFIIIYTLEHIVFSIFYTIIVQTRVPLCSTAIWNSTFSTLAGAISNPGPTSTLLSSPYDMTFDGSGNMYVADYNNHRIQQFSLGIYQRIY